MLIIHKNVFRNIIKIINQYISVVKLKLQFSLKLFGLTFVVFACVFFIATAAYIVFYPDQSERMVISYISKKIGDNFGLRALRLGNMKFFYAKNKWAPKIRVVFEKVYVENQCNNNIFFDKLIFDINWVRYFLSNNCLLYTSDAADD